MEGVPCDEAFSYKPPVNTYPPPVDTDGDGITDDKDSCPTTPNIGKDTDGDGIDDACDPTGTVTVSPTLQTTARTFRMPIT